MAATGRAARGGDHAGAAGGRRRLPHGARRGGVRSPFRFTATSSGIRASRLSISIRSSCGDAPRPAWARSSRSASRRPSPYPFAYPSMYSSSPEGRGDRAVAGPPSASLTARGFEAAFDGASDGTLWERIGRFRRSVGVVHRGELVAVVDDARPSPPRGACGTWPGPSGRSGPRLGSMSTTAASQLRSLHCADDRHHVRDLHLEPLRGVVDDGVRDDLPFAGELERLHPADRLAMLGADRADRAAAGNRPSGTSGTGIRRGCTAGAFPSRIVRSTSDPSLSSPAPSGGPRSSPPSRRRRGRGRGSRRTPGGPRPRRAAGGRSRRPARRRPRRTAAPGP